VSRDFRSHYFSLKGNQSLSWGPDSEDKAFSNAASVSLVRNKAVRCFHDNVVKDVKSMKTMKLKEKEQA
jgi:hypothetical protein